MLFPAMREQFATVKSAASALAVSFAAALMPSSAEAADFDKETVNALGWSCTFQHRSEFGNGACLTATADETQRYYEQNIRPWYVYMRDLAWDIHGAGIETQQAQGVLKAGDVLCRTELSTVNAVRVCQQQMWSVSYPGRSFMGQSYEAYIKTQISRSDLADYNLHRFGSPFLSGFGGPVFSRNMIAGFNSQDPFKNTQWNVISTQAAILTGKRLTGGSAAVAREMEGYRKSPEFRRAAKRAPRGIAPAPEFDDAPAVDLEDRVAALYERLKKHDPIYGGLSLNLYCGDTSAHASIEGCIKAMEKYDRKHGLPRDMAEELDIIKRIYDGEDIRPPPTPKKQQRRDYDPSVRTDATNPRDTVSYTAMASAAPSAFGS